MTYEILIKRTIWVAECECGKDERTENPPKERFCAKCAKWISYKEISYIGPKITP